MFCLVFESGEPTFQLSNKDDKISDFSTFARKSPHLESKQLPNWISMIGKADLTG